MYGINHNDAVALEFLIRKLYNCGRTGVSGLADADHFATHPMDAAIMVVSYIYARGLQKSDTEYDEFLFKYDTIFNYPEENDAANEVDNYIADLASIVDKYIQ